MIRSRELACLQQVTYHPLEGDIFIRSCIKAAGEYLTHARKRIKALKKPNCFFNFNFTG
jgi:hypothetical protein